MTTTDHPTGIKTTKDGRQFTPDAVARQTEGQEKGLAVLAEPWICPDCGRDDLTLRSKGIHLRWCKKNPDRPRKPAQRGQHRTDAVACEWCDKKISAASMQGHLDNSCRVLRAIREGRLVQAPVQPDWSSIVTGCPECGGDFPTPATGGRITCERGHVFGDADLEIRPDPFTHTIADHAQHARQAFAVPPPVKAALLDAVLPRPEPDDDEFPAATAEEVINMAVAQVMDGRPFSYVLALEVAHRVDDLVVAMREAW